MSLGGIAAATAPRGPIGACCISDALVGERERERLVAGVSAESPKRWRLSEVALRILYSGNNSRLSAICV